MTEQQKENLACRIGAVSVFRGILDTKPMSALLDFLCCDKNTQNKMSLFGKFVYSLSDFNYSFSDFLRCSIFADENKYVTSAAQKAEISSSLYQNTNEELKLFSYLTTLTSAELCEDISYGGYVPCFENNAIDFIKVYGERVKNINRYGYGIFATANMFTVEDENIIPVKSADGISTESFIGYENERKQVFDNTQALIDGKPAANVLLFGDAGTGKSSTVKACANHFASEGVRLIEIRKDQLFSLPHIMGKIADNPLKFIIFIDDLSFNKNDDCFSMLKAALEGSASAKSKNAVIYATSNRRHIVKENFSDRTNENDIHHSDTVQELMSLSDRFGLTVYFERPNKMLYLDIIHKLADKNGIMIDRAELDVKAEAFALNKGTRSPRAAEQFINSLI